MLWTTANSARHASVPPHSRTNLLRLGWALDAAALRVGYAGASALSHAMRHDRDVGARALCNPVRALLES